MSHYGGQNWATFCGEIERKYLVLWYVVLKEKNIYQEFLLGYLLGN